MKPLGRDFGAINRAGVEHNHGGDHDHDPQ
jgi:hypothetical protein